MPYHCIKIGSKWKECSDAAAEACFVAHTRRLRESFIEQLARDVVSEQEVQAASGLAQKAEVVDRLSKKLSMAECASFFDFGPDISRTQTAPQESNLLSGIL